MAVATKRMLSFLLAVVMVFALVPVSVFASEDAESYDDPGSAASDSDDGPEEEPGDDIDDYDDEEGHDEDDGEDPPDDDGEELPAVDEEELPAVDEEELPADDGEEAPPAGSGESGGEVEDDIEPQARRDAPEEEDAAPEEPEIFEVTFELNGGESEDELSFDEIESGATWAESGVEEPETAREGYEFNGWEPTLPADDFVIEEDLTYTAQWEEIAAGRQPITARLDFNYPQPVTIGPLPHTRLLRSGAPAEPPQTPPEEITVGEDGILPELPTPNAVEGWDFVGWYGEDGNRYVSGQEIGEGVASLFLTARWSKKALTVTYKNGGETVYVDDIFYGDTTFYDGPELINEDGFTHEAWYWISPLGVEEDFVFETTQLTADAVLYARFNSLWNIDFVNPHDTKDGPAGTKVHTSRLASGQMILGPGGLDTSLMVGPAGENGEDSVYSFDYWYKSGDAEQKEYIFNTERASGNMTLIAKFTQDHYIYYNTTGDPVDPPLDSVTHGANAEAPAAWPTWAGYTFRCWSTSADGAEGDFFVNSKTPNSPSKAAIENDVDLYAVWDAGTVDYKVVYWLERPNFTEGDGDPGTAQANYIYHDSDVFRATSGSEVDYTVRNSAPVNNTNIIKAGIKVGGITYAEFRHGEKKQVQGDGLTVINVYFKRVPFEIKFDLLPNTGQNVGFYTSNFAAELNFKNNTYRQGYNVASPSQYSFWAKYEQDIENDWPSSYNAAFSATGSYWIQGDSSWSSAGSPNFGFKGWEPNLSTKRFTLTSELLPAGGAASRTFKANWSRIRQINVYYHLESTRRQLADGAGTFARAKTDGWNNYVLSDTHTQTNHKMSDTSRLTPKSITGMGPGREPYGVTYTSAHTDHNFYYLRLRKNIILNANGGAFTGSGHDDGDASLSGANSIKTISGVMYGEKVSFYVDNEGNHLSDAKNPVRPGYEFLGWFTDADLTTAYKLAGEGVTGGQAHMTASDANVELWAKWQAASIQVEYYLTAVAGDEAVETQPYGKGDYVVFPGDYVAGTQIDGLGTFRYWAYRSAAGKFIKYNAGSRLDDSLKLYAMWDTDSFRVTYIAPDATAETQKYSPADDLSYDVTAEANIFAPTGTFVYQDDNGTINNDMIFYGWRDESTGKTYLPGSSMPMSGHKTLVAMFGKPGDLIQYVYVSNLNGAGNTAAGGSARMNDTINLDNALFLPQTVREEDGTLTLYRQSGWTLEADKADWKAADNGATLGFKAPLALTQQMTRIYGVWEPADMLTLTYDPNGGVGTPVKDSAAPAPRYADFTVRGNDGEPGPAGFTRAGYYFTGWALSAGGKAAYAPGAPIRIGVNTTLYAVWAAANTEYTIQHYLVNAAGTATLQAPDTQTLSGITGTLSPNASPLSKYDGFRYAAGYENGGDKEILNGVIAADESLVLKLYYIELPVIIVDFTNANVENTEKYTKVYGEYDPVAFEDLADRIQAEVNRQLVEAGYAEYDITVTVSGREKGENVGFYSYNDYIEWESGNYSFTSGKVQLSADLGINPRPIAIKANDETVTRGQAPPEFSCTWGTGGTGSFVPGAPFVVNAELGINDTPETALAPLDIRFTTTYTTSGPAGAAVPINVVENIVQDRNYTVVYVPGILNVTGDNNNNNSNNNNNNNDNDDRNRNYDNGAATTTKTTITITTINGNESPLANLPPGADGLATVMDSEIPLASLPKSGGSSGKAPVMLSGLLAAFAASSKSEKREEEAG